MCEDNHMSANVTDAMRDLLDAGGSLDDGDACDYCGQVFNPAAEGHTHEAGDCDCVTCSDQEWKATMIGKSFCSPECEMHA